MDTLPKSDIEERDTERATRRVRTLDEKLAILREAAQPGASIAAVARKHGMNANLLFGWRRLHRSGLLEGKRHAKSVPLLPVTITTPTLTPTDPKSGRPVRRRRSRTRLPDSVAESCVELVLSEGVRVRLYGQAQRLVLDRILEQLVNR
jgi:transposase